MTDAATSEDVVTEQQVDAPLSAPECAYIGMGANIGDRHATIARALEELAALDGVELLGVSELRETDPVGMLDQPQFLNGACLVHTTLSPQALLGALLAIELRLGRTRDGVRWGPRTIDLDLLLFGERTVDTPGLTVPHPRLSERGFVLEPLLDLEPDLRLPDGRKVKVLFSEIK